MKRGFIISLVTFFSLLGFTQDSTWKKMVIDENLTISFPGSTTLLDTTLIKKGEKYRFKAYKHENEFSTFALLITPGETDMNVDDKETWKKALAAMSKGALKALSENGFTCSPADTIIDSIPCIRSVCKNDMISTMRTYLFLVNDKMYSLQYASLDPEAIERGELDLFLNSVHFKKDGIKEMQFESKVSSKFYKIGYLIGMLTFPAIVIGLIIYFVRRNNM